VSGPATKEKNPPIHSSAEKGKSKNRTRRHGRERGAAPQSSAFLPSGKGTAFVFLSPRRKEGEERMSRNQNSVKGRTHERQVYRRLVARLHLKKKRDLSTLARRKKKGDRMDASRHRGRKYSPSPSRTRHKKDGSTSSRESARPDISDGERRERERKARRSTSSPPWAPPLGWGGKARVPSPKEGGKKGDRRLSCARGEKRKKRTKTSPCRSARAGPSRSEKKARPDVRLPIEKKGKKKEKKTKRRETRI